MSDLVQLSFDYSVLSPEQAQRTQEAEYRIIGRTQKTIVENGRDLLAVKQDIGHGHFLNWIRSLGISEDTAQRWMSVAIGFKDIEIPQTAVFDKTALYLLSNTKVTASARQEAKERAEQGEKITEEVARQIRDAHKAKEQAEEAAQQAQANAKATQQELFQSRAESHNVIVQLSKQIEDLQSQITTISTPEKVIVEKEVMPADYTEKQAALEKLITEKAKLTEQRDKLRELADELGKDLDTLREANEAKRARELQEARILQNWREVTNTFHKQVLKLLTQFPTPVDTQIFEAEDWERLSQVEGIARRFLGECELLSNRSSSMVVDAR